MAQQWLLGRTALYDGHCGFCRSAARWLGRMNWLGKVELLDATDDLHVRPRFPQLSRERLLKDFHVVRSDGQTHTGFGGYRSLARVLPPLWPVLPLLYLPPVPWIGRKVYRYVADHRCTGSACRV